eukprot:TRINITY_DN12026_c1_g1_i3.p1 TRINITY_DN12026_c1_g1~~TRINITY_DN12026_c1_g1_i3.p1  ORF type:complete len:352 (+),score=30.26 TRINITY_DN12026_c1_g1_i3:99-1154(+)
MEEDKKICNRRVLQQYTIGACLGRGSYGAVYKGQRLSDGVEVALKVVKHKGEKGGIASSTLREIATLKRLSHENIIQLFDVILDTESYMQGGNIDIVLVLELMDCDLAKLAPQIHSAHYRGTNVWCLPILMQQMLQGLQACHACQVVHRDLKPQNILFKFDSQQLKIADFGLAKLRVRHPEEDVRFTNEVVTLWYRPPELLLGDQFYGPAIDMWSLGCIFVELMIGHPLFSAESEIEQLDKIFRVLGTPTEQTWEGVIVLERVKMFQIYKPQNFAELRNENGVPFANMIGGLAQDLVLSMITLNPNKRITAAQALQHPFFNELNMFKHHRLISYKAQQQSMWKLFQKCNRN